MAEYEERLIIISRANPHSQFLSQITRKNVKKILYSFESTSLDDILCEFFLIYFLVLLKLTLFFNVLFSNIVQFLFFPRRFLSK